MKAKSRHCERPSGAKQSCRLPRRPQSKAKLCLLFKKKRTNPSDLLRGLLAMTFMSLATLVLAACGFSPVYGTLGQGQSAAAEAYLSQVSIDNIPDREGQYLRNALIDRF